MKKLSFILAAAVLVACQSGKQTEEKSTEEATALRVSLVKKWETDSTLTTAESVYYDAANELLYVSCIGAVPPDAKDGDGFIARLGLDGVIIDTQWVVGLDGPKGMGMVGNMLYVTNIDEVIEIDVNTGEIRRRFAVEGAEFLNDITVDADGTVFISDSNVSKIFSLSNGEVTLWAEGESLGGPNGLLAENGRLMVASFGAGKFSTLGLSDKEIQMVVDSIPAGDGVVAFEGDYFVSNWNGEVYYVTEDGKKTKLLDTKAQGFNAADIGIVPGQSMLLVPTFFGNTVTAYEIARN